MWLSDVRTMESWRVSRSVSSCSGWLGLAKQLRLGRIAETVPTAAGSNARDASSAAPATMSGR